MAERLPISLPEVYRRVNNIVDPVKRAGAQAFSGVYAPVLSLPEYFYRPITVTTMRNRALRAKEFAIRQANEEIGVRPPEEFDFSQIDALVKNAGLQPLDILDIPNRVSNSLRRSGFPSFTFKNPLTLAVLNTWSIDRIAGLTGVSKTSALHTRSELNVLTRLDREQMEKRIADVREKRIEASKPKQRKPRSNT